MPPVVPEEWRDQLREFLRHQFDEGRDHLIASDFKHTVWLRFPDGSSLVFKHAIYLMSRDRDQLAVFAEHCGYHVFPLTETEIDLMQTVQTDIGTP